MRLLILSLLLLSASSLHAQQRLLTGHTPSVSVLEETRLDWMFALANQSPARVPDGWLDGYDSTKTTYELYVPPKLSSRNLVSLVLFVPPSNRSNIVRVWKDAATKHSVILAGVHEAGNGVAMPKRVRAVMDVLDDVRRRFNVDPDKTYISGYSGGGRVACSIAFALPEYFGGVIPVCAGGSLRQEPWLRQRVIDRLSIAQLTGESDFNRGECERLHQTEMDEIGVRCKTWVTPKLGHEVPGSAVLDEALTWLMEDVAAHKKFATAWPASSLAQPLSREEWASALLAEGVKRTKKPKQLYSGLMQIKGVYTRWNDLPQAKAALRILTEAQDGDLSWEKEDVAEQRRFLVARARAVDAYASGPLPKQYQNQKPNMLAAAVELWEQVIKDGQDKNAVAQGQKRIPALKEMLGQK
jgi:predicted esterase